MCLQTWHFGILVNSIDGYQSIISKLSTVTSEMWNIREPYRFAPYFDITTAWERLLMRERFDPLPTANPQILRES